MTERKIRLFERNKQIRLAFWKEMRKGSSCMDAYLVIGQQFFLSDERIREIVANRKC